MWTITSGALASGTFLDFIKGLFGWSADAERIRVLAYVAYAMPVLWLYVRPAAPSAPVVTAPSHQVAAGV